MASAQQPAPGYRPQSRTRHAPCALPRPPSARPLARLPAALRLPARHRGRVLLKAAGQWGRRSEPIGPMDAPLGPGGGRSPGRGGAGRAPTPASLSLARLRGSAPPFGHLGGDSSTFPFLSRKSQSLRARVSARP